MEFANTDHEFMSMLLLTGEPTGVRTKQYQSLRDEVDKRIKSDGDISGSAVEMLMRVDFPVKGEARQRWARHFAKWRLDVAGLAQAAEEAATIASKPSDGGDTGYYRNPTTKQIVQCQDLIEALNLTWNEANIFKSIWRQAMLRKDGKLTGKDRIYCAKKIEWFAKREQGN